MKTTYMIIALLLAVVVLAATAAPVVRAIDTGVNIKVTLLNQDPDPVQPGDTVELRFKVENTGSTSLNNVLFQLLPAYPFTLIGNDTQNLGTVNAQLIDANAIIVKYQLQVDPNAPTGQYTINARYRQGGAWIQLQDFTVSVKTHTPDIVVDAIGTTPDVVVPGQQFNMTVNLENQLSQRAKDVKVKADFSDASIPFAPFDSTSEISIPDFAGGSAKTVAFHLIANPDAAAGLYKVPITLSYEDLNGNKFNKSLVTGVRVSSPPALLALVDTSTLVSGVSSGSVTVKIVNRGLTDVHFMTVTAHPTDVVGITSSPEVYLGKIESDDFQTADFSIALTKVSGDTVAIPLTLSFMDATNRPFTQNVTLDVRLLTTAEAQKAGIVKGTSPWLLLLALIVVVGVIWWWRRRSRKKR